MKMARSESAYEGLTQPPKNIPAFSLVAGDPRTTPIRHAHAIFTLKQCRKFVEQRLNRPLFNLFSMSLLACGFMRGGVSHWLVVGSGCAPRPKSIQPQISCFPVLDIRPHTPLTALHVLCPRMRRHPGGKLPGPCTECLWKRWPHAWNNPETGDVLRSLRFNQLLRLSQSP